jgi:hypothetical protein
MRESGEPAKLHVVSFFWVTSTSENAGARAVKEVLVQMMRDKRKRDCFKKTSKY